MTNILLVFTGGTIGSQLENGTIDTDSTAGFKLIRLFQQQYPNHNQVSFKPLQPVQILSENLHPEIWRTVIAAIEAEDLSAFDGIIVTHGTDTLAFSAAAFGLYFGGLNIPMLLVSSNRTLDDPNANGLKNFLCAVEYIRQNRRPGVFVPYQNPGRTMHVHIATRLSACQPLSGDFVSVQAKPYLTFEHGAFKQCHELPTTQDRPYRLRSQFARILLIRPYPGLDYTHFNLDNADAVLHDLYHSGTACVSEQWGESHNLIAFSRQCRQRGLPLYLAPAIKSDAAYSSTRELLAQGVRIIWNTSIEAAHVKLMLAHGNFKDNRDIDDFLERDIAWEQIDANV